MGDITEPEISNCPHSITKTVVLLLRQTSTSVSWQEPTATDDSGAPPTVTQTHHPGDMFPIGSTTEVTYTFTDGAGNEAICSFVILIGKAYLCIYIISCFSTNYFHISVYLMQFLYSEWHLVKISVSYFLYYHPW